MHLIQEQTLNKYRRLFPDEALRLTAKKTGIQLTRVFRIFNGYEMKLSEYLSFQRVLSNFRYENEQATQCPYSQDLKYLTNHFFDLDEDTIQDIRRKVEFKLELKKLSRPMEVLQ